MSKLRNPFRHFKEGRASQEIGIEDLRDRPSHVPSGATILRAGVDSGEFVSFGSAEARAALAAAFEELEKINKAEVEYEKKIEEYTKEIENDPSFIADCIREEQEMRELEQINARNARRATVPARWKDGPESSHPPEICEERGPKPLRRFGPE